MEFVGDAIDEVGFHLRKFFLPEPVAESDEEDQYYGDNGQQGKKKGGHHQFKDSEPSVENIHVQTEAGAIAMILSTADTEIPRLVLIGDILQGASYPDTVAGLNSGIDVIILFPLAVEVDVFVALKSDVHGLDKKGIFQASVKIVLFYDTFQQAIDIVSFPKGEESAVGNLLFEETKTSRVIPVQTFQLRHIPVNEPIHYLLPPWHDLVIAYSCVIFGFNDPQFCEIVMVVLQLIGIIQQKKLYAGKDQETDDSDNLMSCSRILHH